MCPRTNCPGGSRQRAASHQRRTALTLVELLLATTIMTIMVGVMGTLALAVKQGWQHSQGQSDTAQQARVVLERISRRVQGAYCSPLHPGCGVATTTVGINGFPDTLVVWSPAAAPSNPNGPPKVSECVLFCPDPTNPGQLVEITAPSDNRDLPLDSQLSQSATLTLLAEVKAASTSSKVVLTRLLRTADAGSGTVVVLGGTGSSTALRGAVRFNLVLRPSASEWSQYQAGTLAWSSLSFPLGLQGASFGIRNVWLRTELQFVPPGIDGNQASSDQAVVAVFGSATRTYSLAK